MIRNAQTEDIDKIADIWLCTNIKSHSFIDVNYWKDNLKFVKKMLPKSKIYVYEIEKNIKGFIGLDKDYIQGIFVVSDFQSQGYGKKLLDFVKQENEQLLLNVYKNNKRAIKFYEREDFKIIYELKDKVTNEIEYQMIWKKITNNVK